MFDRLVHIVVNRFTSAIVHCVQEVDDWAFAMEMTLPLNNAVNPTAIQAEARWNVLS
jgi:hypothetical protein